MSSLVGQILLSPGSQLRIGYYRRCVDILSIVQGNVFDEGVVGFELSAQIDGLVDMIFGIPVAFDQAGGVDAAPDQIVQPDALSVRRDICHGIGVGFLIDQTGLAAHDGFS